MSVKDGHKVIGGLHGLEGCVTSRWYNAWTCCRHYGTTGVIAARSRNYGTTGAIVARTRYYGTTGAIAARLRH